MTVRGPIAREQGINFFAVARTDPSAFMRRYYQRVGERYLSAEGESMRFEVGLFFKTPHRALRDVRNQAASYRNANASKTRKRTRHS
jgi:hypothetical protein